MNMTLKYYPKILKSMIGNSSVYPKGIGENEQFGSDLSFKHTFSWVGHAHVHIISYCGFSFLHLINFNNDLI